MDFWGRGIEGGWTRGVKGKTGVSGNEEGEGERGDTNGLGRNGKKR